MKKIKWVIAVIAIAIVNLHHSGKHTVSTTPVQKQIEMPAKMQEPKDFTFLPGVMFL